MPLPFRTVVGETEEVKRLPDCDKTSFTSFLFLQPFLFSYFFLMSKSWVTFVHSTATAHAKCELDAVDDNFSSHLDWLSDLENLEHRYVLLFFFLCFSFGGVCMLLRFYNNLDFY
jgi:hypothetical protein